MKQLHVSTSGTFNVCPIENDGWLLMPEERRRNRRLRVARVSEAGCCGWLLVQSPGIGTRLLTKFGNADGAGSSMQIVARDRRTFWWLGLWSGSPSGFVQPSALTIQILRGG